MKGLLCKIHKRLMDKMTVKYPPLSSSSPLFLLGLLTPVAFCFFYTSPASATTVNANPSYVWATYRNLDTPSDTYVNKEMCNSQQTCSNPFALLGNNRYQVYGLVVDTPLNFTTLSYGSARYTMYIWSGGQNLGGNAWGDTAEQYSQVFNSTISGTLRDGSAVSVAGVCSRTWQDVHQIKLECYYQNLPANTTFNITTLRFGNSSLTGYTPIFENNPNLSGGITYISNYEFTYSTSNSAESAYLQEITNQNATIINQNQQIINNQQATTDAINEQNERDQEDRDNLEQQAQDGQDAAEDAGAEAEAQGQSFIQIISSFISGLSNLSASDCVIDADLSLYNGGSHNFVNLCSGKNVSVSNILNIIGGVVVSIFIVRMALSVVHAMQALYREYQQ